MKHEKKWPLWGGACFAIILLGAFGQHLLALIIYAAGSDLHSYILLIPFVSGYLLYLRRDQLPKERFADLPFGFVLLACGVGVFLVTHWLAFGGRAPADNYHFVLSDHIVPLLSCLGGVFLFRARVDARGGFSAGLSHFYGSHAGCYGRYARDRF